VAEIDGHTVLQASGLWRLPISTFLDSLPSLPAEHCPLLPDRLQTERVVAASLQAVVRRIDVRDRKDLSDIL
jgi:hypothetical protein